MSLWESYLFEPSHKSTTVYTGSISQVTCLRVPVPPHSGLGISCLHTWYVQGCYMVAWVFLFANLPCPSDTIWCSHGCHVPPHGGPGMFVFISDMSQQHNVVAWAHLFVSLLCSSSYLAAWAYPFAHLLCPRATIWWLWHASLHTHYVPVPPCDGLGTPLHT